MPQQYFFSWLSPFTTMHIFHVFLFVSFSVEDFPSLVAWPDITCDVERATPFIYSFIYSFIHAGDTYAFLTFFMCNA